MPERVARCLTQLIRDHLPHVVESSGAMDDWSLAGPAILAAAAGTLDAILTLRPLEHELDESNLLRGLYEYSVTFAWIAADPDIRIQRWLKYDYSERLRTDADFRAAGTPLLDDDVRAELEAYGAEVRMMPDLASRSDAADASWSAMLTERIPQVGEQASFRGLYRLIFRGSSGFTHPTTRALTRFVSGGDSQYQVSVERPYTGAIATASCSRSRIACRFRSASLAGDSRRGDCLLGSPWRSVGPDRGRAHRRGLGPSVRNPVTQAGVRVLGSRVPRHPMAVRPMLPT